MKCPRCQQDNPPQAKFCLECGVPVDAAPAGLRSYADLTREIERLGRASAESAEQQTATSEILKVISSSPTDVQPVFDAIIQNAVRICGASNGTVFRFDGRLIHVAAHHNLAPEAADVVNQVFPIPADSGSVTGRAILARSVIHLPDVVREPEPTRPKLLAAGAILAVPMLRDGEPIGAITVIRRQPESFSDGEIELLQTFADQAVIAIENVRLFDETKEALERQTATADILKAISRSPTDVQPVFDAIAESALRLLSGAVAAVLRRVGDGFRVMAMHAVEQRVGMPPNPEYVPIDPAANFPSRVFVSKTMLNIPDWSAIDLPVHERGVYENMGVRSSLMLPLLRAGDCVGVLFVGRTSVRPYDDKDIALMQSFADQAVIAIENVRLFNETKEALEQQTATSEILKVIARSPIDTQPVFDAIAQSGRRLCDGNFCTVVRYDGELLHLAASAHIAAEGVEAMKRNLASRPSRAMALGRAILDGAVVLIPDVLADAEYDQSVAQAVQLRSIIAVPMLRDGTPIGAISVSRAEARPFTETEIALLQTFADQAVIAIENVRLFNETKEALDRQTATSEILRVISRSPTDVQPTFDAIAASAARLCAAVNGMVFRFDGELIHVAAHHNLGGDELDAIRSVFPLKPGRGSIAGRAIASRGIVHVADLSRDPEYPLAQVVQAGFRTALSVPMLREGMPIGTINVMRMAVEPFAPEQIALLQTFADQAVIAIENVRLFNETKEALEQQTATAQILRVISSSPTDIQPVLDAVTATAARVCGATDALTMRVEGQGLRRVAHFGPIPLVLPAVRPLTAGSASGRAIVEGRTIHIHDILATEAARDYPEAQPADAGAQWRTMLAVPLVREGAAIGAILIRRTETRPFTEREIQLLETFASQAVIAIENVRLFKQLETSNAELKVALEQQTATSEILKVIAQAQTNVQPVFEAIAASALRLCEAKHGNVLLFDGTQIHLAAFANVDAHASEIVRSAFPRPPDRTSASTRAILTRAVAEIPDVRDDPEYQLGDMARQAGFRSALSVPLLRGGHAIGAITVTRTHPGQFPGTVIALLSTFADQAVIAIENVRLFTELQARTKELEQQSHQLEKASQHKSEFLANMSHELRTPLNAVIGFSEVLSEGMFGELNDKQEEYARDIHASGQHLLSLINDILDLSKVEAGRMELELTDFHLPAALDNALTLVRERAGRHGITLHMSMDEQLGEVRADERKIRQVVLNLLSNAIKFTPEGGSINVRAMPGDGVVEVSVSDTGVGIASEDQEAIFEEFRQVGTAAKKVEGTGLGLALSRKFIELHGGRIWVKSQVGAGSTFMFTIPMSSDA